MPPSRPLSLSLSLSLLWLNPRDRSPLLSEPLPPPTGCEAARTAEGKLTSHGENKRFESRNPHLRKCRQARNLPSSGKSRKSEEGSTIQQNRAIMECVRAGRVEAGARRAITGCLPHGRRTERRRSSVPWPRGVGRGRAASEPPSTAPRASLDKTERTEASRTASGSSGLDYSRLLECCEPDAAPLNVAVLVSGGVDSSVALQVRTDPDLFSFHGSDDVFIYIERVRECA